METQDKIMYLMAGVMGVLLLCCAVSGIISKINRRIEQTGASSRLSRWADDNPEAVEALRVLAGSSAPSPEERSCDRLVKCPRCGMVAMETENAP